MAAKSSRISKSNLVSSCSNRCLEGNKKGEDFVGYETKLLRVLEINQEISMRNFSIYIYSGPKNKDRRCFGGT